MRTQCIRAVVVMVVAGGTACQSTQVAPTPNRDGMFRFRDVAGTETFTGSFHVTADTVTMESSSGTCDYLPASRQSKTILYLCGHLTFAYDRQNPMRQPSVSWPYSVTQNGSECAIPSSGAGGRRGCSAVEHTQNEQQLTGRTVLHPERVDGAVAKPAP